MRKFGHKDGKYNHILNDIFANLNINHLFPMSNFDQHQKQNHKIELIQLIIEMCINKKQDYTSRCNTLAERNSFLRNKLKKLLHFRGQ